MVRGEKAAVRGAVGGDAEGDGGGGVSVYIYSFCFNTAYFSGNKINRLINIFRFDITSFNRIFYYLFPHFILDNIIYLLLYPLL